MVGIIYEFLKTWRDVKTEQLNKEYSRVPEFRDSQSGLGKI